MAPARLPWREGLHDIAACSNTKPEALYHWGFREPVAKSTLAEANETRDWPHWGDLATSLMRKARTLYAGEDLGLDLENTISALDSTTIDLWLTLFPWADFRRTKAGIKWHTRIDWRGPIPSSIYLSGARAHDVLWLDDLILEPGTFYVMDRGYMDFKRLNLSARAGAFLVTRAKDNLRFFQQQSRSGDHAAGVRSDQIGKLTLPKAREAFPSLLRKGRCFDQETQRYLVFLTNPLELPALTVAHTYRSRRQGAQRSGKLETSHSLAYEIRHSAAKAEDHVAETVAKHTHCMTNTHKLATILVVLVGLFPGCEEKKMPVATPPPAPTPLPTATPTPLAAPTPIALTTPTPAARLAPDGILYVQEEISITTEFGVRRLSAGKEVHVLREEGDMVTVKDGDLEVSAPASNFTRDMDVRDALVTKRTQLQKIAVSTSLQKKTQFEAEHAALEQTAAEATSRTAQTQLVRQIEALKETLSVWDARISKVQNERADKDDSRRYGYYQNGYYRKGRVTSLSADASQVDALIATRDKLRAQLSQLESQR